MVQPFPRISSRPFPRYLQNKHWRNLVHTFLCSSFIPAASSTLTISSTLPIYFAFNLILALMPFFPEILQMFFTSKGYLQLNTLWGETQSSLSANRHQQGSSTNSSGVRAATSPWNMLIWASLHSQYLWGFLLSYLRPLLALFILHFLMALPFLKPLHNTQWFYLEINFGKANYGFAFCFMFLTSLDPFELETLVLTCSFQLFLIRMWFMQHLNSLHIISLV